MGARRPQPASESDHVLLDLGAGQAPCALHHISSSGHGVGRVTMPLPGRQRAAGSTARPRTERKLLHLSLPECSSCTPCTGDKLDPASDDALHSEDLAELRLAHESSPFWFA